MIPEADYRILDAMTAAGNTNVTIGLVWGWHALTANQPLTEGLARAISEIFSEVIIAPDYADDAVDALAGR